MKKRLSTFLRIPLAVRLYVSLLALLPVGLTHAQTWNRNDNGTWQWTDPNNWLDAIVPDNPADSLVFFNLTTGSRTLTIQLNTGGDQVLKGGAEFYLPATAVPNVTMDLQGNRLIFDGGVLEVDVNSATTTSRDVVTFTNGTVQFGTVDNAASINIGPGDQAANNGGAVMNVYFGANSTLDTVNAHDLFISTTNSRAKRYALDLTQATLRTGDTLHALTFTGTVSIANHRTNSIISTGVKEGILKLGYLTNLTIGEDLIIGQNLKATAGENTISGSMEFLPDSETVDLNIGRDLRIATGDRATGSILNSPEVLNLSVGNFVTPGGVIYIGYKDRGEGIVDDEHPAPQNGVTSGSFVGGTVGGSLDAYIGEFRVGQNTRPAGSASGVFDFRNATSTLIEISGDAFIGVGIGATGNVYLKSGNVFSKNLTVGEATGADRSVLDLNGVTWTVAETLVVGDLADIHLRLAADVIGLDLTSDNPLGFVIDGDGLILAWFTSDEPGSYWAIRMKGNQEDLLSDYVSNGRIEALGDYAGLASVYFDGDYTYFGYSAIPEPTTMTLLMGVALTALFSARRVYRKK